MAEEYFRRIGHQKTSVADIASCLGMSSATIYRFFPSRAAINRSICGRFIEQTTQLADAVARQEAPAHEKLESLFNLLHEERRKNLIQEKPVHDLIVAATTENWPIISAHSDHLVAIIEEIIEEGTEAGKFSVEDAARSARSAMNAFVPFYHPILVEERVRNAEDAKGDLSEQICFILKALGGNDERRRLSGRIDRAAHRRGLRQIRVTSALAAAQEKSPRPWLKTDAFLTNCISVEKALE
ncbi:TetR/AcrR family transcriptional regulator [Rhizobium gallicum]|uniref:TetR/AcrR family transcriptional regulator n=1 Tax=Rhizobium gallicum TaxID=56730 RepID=UPI001EF7A28F|nr:TetR/AcrR family transcriptional regulator [Rhizobium gallicum]ULJ75659.1 TetR family transcriptional regulator [Rhizobium gallicum]